jgi:hypothetical protein
MGGLSRLCEEFHFGELGERLSQFRESCGLKESVTLKDLEARKRLLALEERMQQRDCEIAALQSELSQHFQAQELSSEAIFGPVAHLEAEIAALVTASALPPSTFPRQNLLRHRLCRPHRWHRQCPHPRWRLLRLDRFSQLSLLRRTRIL